MAWHYGQGDNWEFMFSRWGRFVIRLQMSWWVTDEKSDELLFGEDREKLSLEGWIWQVYSPSEPSRIFRTTMRSHDSRCKTFRKSLKQNQYLPWRVLTLSHNKSN